MTDLHELAETLRQQDFSPSVVERAERAAKLDDEFSDLLAQAYASVGRPQGVDHV